MAENSIIKGNDKVLCMFFKAFGVDADESIYE